MDIADLLTRNRSFRRFHAEPISRQTLVELVELTRRCPSSGNQQPLRYMVSCTAERNAKVFPHVRWAGALKGWSGPAHGERPAGYIIILGDAQSPSSHQIDAGIAAQSMLLAAVERGLGGCMIGSIDRDRLRHALNIPPRFSIVLVIALGRPSETVVLEDSRHPGDLDYWRDENDVHHVPKRLMEELLVEF